MRSGGEEAAVIAGSPLMPPFHWMLTLLTLACVTMAPSAEADDQLAAAPAPAAIVWQGVASCAAQACHGGAVGSVSRRSYALWKESDPHESAFRLLMDEPARRMALRLGLATPPHQAQECLICHASFPATTARGPRFNLAEGVGCESCHGAAAPWLADHSLWEGRLDADAKLNNGMIPQEIVRQSARTCVGCHVGEPGRAVDHRLIAAGHPRLEFEYASYMAALPRHWDEDKARRRDPAIGLRRWLVGQAVVAESSLALLEHQVAPVSTRPWPEFAAFDCAACHHDLRDQPRPPAPGLRVGSLALAGWNTTLAPMLVGDDGPQTQADLRELRRLLAVGDRRAQALPLVAGLRQRVGAASADWQSSELNAGMGKALFAALTQNNDEWSWSRDGVAQRYLALTAIREALEPLDQDPRIAATLPLLLRMHAALERASRTTSAPRLIPNDHDKALEELQQLWRN